MVGIGGHQFDLSIGSKLEVDETKTAIAGGHLRFSGWFHVFQLYEHFGQVAHKKLKSVSSYSEYAQQHS